MRDELPPLGPQSFPFEEDEVLLAAPLAAAGTAPVIDVMVAFTPRTRQAAGSAQAVQRQVQLAVAETNQGYESGDMSTDLTRLSRTGDGYLDAVHQARTTYGADLVSLWIESKQQCGIAHLLRNPNRVDPAIGFSVVARECATGHHSFGHELGHNMGAAHAREANTGPGAFAYSNGFKQPGKFRSIVSYDGACACPLVNFWSNPALRVNNFPAGNGTTQNFPGPQRPDLELRDSRRSGAGGQLRRKDLR